MLITRVILLMIDVVMNKQGRVTWRIARFLLIKILWSVILYFNIFGLRSPGALWRKSAKYLQTHIQVVLIAANPHWKMLLSGNFGTDWVANAWKPWKPWMPCMLSMPMSKSEIWNQTAYTLCSLLNNTTTVRLKNITIMVQTACEERRHVGFTWWQGTWLQ